MKACLFGKLISPVGNDFVDVHVALGAASGLPDRKGKVAVETAVKDLFAGFFNEYGFFLRERSQLTVCLGC